MRFGARLALALYSVQGAPGAHHAYARFVYMLLCITAPCAVLHMCSLFVALLLPLHTDGVPIGPRVRKCKCACMHQIESISFYR